MSAYRYVPSASGGGLVQLPSAGSYSGTSMAAPLAAAAAPAAAAAAPAGQALMSQLILSLLGNLGAGAAMSVFSPGGAAGPTQTPTATGSKYMIPLSDVLAAQQWAAGENRNRAALNLARRAAGLEELPMVDPNQIIEETDLRARQAAAEAGAREYALGQLGVQQAVQPAIAQAFGGGITSGNQLLESTLGRILNRPDEYGDRALAEMSRGI